MLSSKLFVHSKLSVWRPITFLFAFMQTVKYASSYALELEKKLAEEAAARTELEKKLVAQEAEVAALRGQLKAGQR